MTQISLADLIADLGAAPQQVLPLVHPMAPSTSASFATSLSAIASSYWVWDPAEFMLPDGFDVQHRLHVVAHGATAADVLGAGLRDEVTTAFLINEFTTTVPAASSIVRWASAWQNAPAAAGVYQLRARNQTAVRGTLDNAWMEIQVVQA